MGVDIIPLFNAGVPVLATSDLGWDCCRRPRSRDMREECHILRYKAAKIAYVHAESAQFAKRRRALERCMSAGRVL